MLKFKLLRLVKMPELKDELTIRSDTRQELIDAGVNPYPSSNDRTTTIKGLVDDFEEREKSAQAQTIVGRIMAIRSHGGSAFIPLRDGTGEIQLFIKKDEIGDEGFNFVDNLDIGDFIEATGTPMVTKRGEKSLLVTAAPKMLTKALRPLPEKWHGLKDVEQRYRKRYLDMLMNPEANERFRLRSQIISAMREFMNSKGFLEVETPTLQPIYGGGFARPFKTHHNALDSDFYLRISDEMYLKRLLVGGYEKVYEITKVFRNEGIDRDHNPEFTMFESQTAYEDYNWGMDFYEELNSSVVEKVCGTTTVNYQDTELSFARPWTRMRLVDAVKEIADIDVEQWQTVDEAKTVLAKKLTQKAADNLDQFTTIGELMAYAFEELVEEKLIQPTIVYDYPVEVSPLAKKAEDPRYAERFEVFVMGSEVGNNYSELNDPVELEKRFVHEKKKEAAGFDEAHQTDSDYLEAIQHGMPPACGLGIGVDRMVMFLTNAKSLKEVIVFPTLKPKHDEAE